jgi:hypothetical protein
MKTAVGLGVCVVALVVWDVWLYLSPPKADTISRLIADGASDHPLIPFVFGVLAGHWFWGIKKSR